MTQATKTERRGYSDIAIYPANANIVAVRGNIAQRIGEAAIVGATPAEQTKVAMEAIAMHLEAARVNLGLPEFGLSHLAEVQIFIGHVGYAGAVSQAYLDYLDHTAGRTLTDNELPARAMIVASPPLPEAEPPANTAHVEILARASTIPPTFVVTNTPPIVTLTASAQV